MTCREVADFIMDFVSGNLPPDALASFEHHLRLCANCRNYLRAYEETVKLGKRAFDDSDAPVAADVPEGLVDAILAARRAERR